MAFQSIECVIRRLSNAKTVATYDRVKRQIVEVFGEDSHAYREFCRKTEGMREALLVKMAETARQKAAKQKG